MLHRNRKVELIKDVPLFAGCPKKELEQIAHIADEIDLPEGKDLARQGAPGREFFVLLEGTVEVTRDGQLVDAMTDGDYFGEVALVSEAPRNATVTATSPVRALVVTDREFRMLLRESPEIGAKVNAALAGRQPPAATE